MPEEPALQEYAALAPHYDQRWASYIEITTRETLHQLRLSAGERALDVGCGTGSMLQTLARAHPEAKLFGVDPSVEMLEVAREKFLGPFAPRVELSEAAAEKLPFPDASFDLVLSVSAFHYFRDQRRALFEMKRVLVPGGYLVITDWCHDFLGCRVGQRWLRATGKGHFHVLRSEELGRLLRGAGFHAVELTRFKATWLWGMMTATARAGQQHEPQSQ